MSAIRGELLTYGQEKGPDVKLVVSGDEYYHLMETPEGFTVVYDNTQGLFCYAQVHEKALVSSGVSLAQPPPKHLRRHLRDSAAVRDARAQANFAARKPPVSALAMRNGGSLTHGPNRGLLEGRRLSEGKVRGLTILVNFKDVQSTVTRDEVDQMLNGEGYKANGNFCSVREYFRLMSAGRLDYTNDVVGPFTLSQPRAYYVKKLLVEEALKLAVNSGVDLSQYDSQGEGIVDALSILYAGQTQYLDNLWPHNSYLELRFGAMRTYFYLITSLGRSSSELTIGTFCHETGHLLPRFPDLYDYGQRGWEGDTLESEGMGSYCLMGSGNHLNYGKTPAPVCGYLRDLASWCTTAVELVPGGEFTVRHGDYGTVQRYLTGKPNEYFIVENRSKLGLDQYLPSSGLAVYHCDINGSNEFQEGSARRHYQCALLQADGRQDLERNANAGDGEDLFASIAGTALTHDSRPSSRLWDGSDSGLTLSSVSPPGREMKFRVGTPEAAAGESTLEGAAAPNLSIPDNSPVGITSAVKLSHPKTVGSIEVSFDIQHPYIGDLRVELVSPTGRGVLLHSRLGADKDNLVARFESKMPGSPLVALLGQPIEGSWLLRVSDLASRDKGKLRKWSLAVAPRT